MYYIAEPEYTDDIYGSEYPVCLSLSVVEQLAKAWEMPVDDLLDQMRPATESDISAYGTRDFL